MNNGLIPGFGSHQGYPNGMQVDLWDKPGTYTYTLPANAVMLFVHVRSGGGGGGSGRVDANIFLRCGGLGGAGGGMFEQFLPALWLPDRIRIVVGAGGDGGAARLGASGAANGATGSTGGLSCFLNISPGGGIGGAGGQASSNSTPAVQGRGVESVHPGNSTYLVASADGNVGGIQTNQDGGNGGVWQCSSGGGGGAGRTSGNAAGTAGIGGTSSSLYVPTTTAAAQAVGMSGDDAGNLVGGDLAWTGFGGGGGGCCGTSAGQHAGAGGAGGKGGGGGGGGGAGCSNVACNSGAGGKGGDGVVYVVAFLGKAIRP